MVVVPGIYKRIGDLTHPNAIFGGVTSEIGTVDDYSLTSQWAAAAKRRGYQGLHYQPRFTPGKETALALFGQTGSFSGYPVLGHISSSKALEAEGYLDHRSSVPSTKKISKYIDNNAIPN